MKIKELIEQLSKNEENYRVISNSDEEMSDEEMDKLFNDFELQDNQEV